MISKGSEKRLEKVCIIYLEKNRTIIYCMTFYNFFFNLIFSDK